MGRPHLWTVAPHTCTALSRATGTPRPSCRGGEGRGQTSASCQLPPQSARLSGQRQLAPQRRRRLSETRGTWPGTSAVEKLMPKLPGQGAHVCRASGILKKQPSGSLRCSEVRPGNASIRRREHVSTRASGPSVPARSSRFSARATDALPVGQLLRPGEDGRRILIRSHGLINPPGCSTGDGILGPRGTLTD